jgi:hypothetical protein
MNETTPLLPGQNGHTDENSTTTRRTSSSRIVTILIWASVTTSALTFLYNLAIYLVVKLWPYYDFLTWGMKDAIEALLPLVCIFLDQIDCISNTRLELPMRGRQPVRHLQTDRPQRRRMAPHQRHIRSVDRTPLHAQPRS